MRPPSSSIESASRLSETSNALRPACSVCGNVYDKAFEVLMDGKRYTFDSFECAIHRLAPTCAHCACRIVGHGLEAAGAMYCCAHCAEESGENRLRDRA